jgi:hypothetical protein
MSARAPPKSTCQATAIEGASVEAATVADASGKAAGDERECAATSTRQATMRREEASRRFT